MNSIADADDDSGLLRRYAEAQDEDAFAELVRRHIDGVYSSASRRLGGDVQLAQDVTQEVFVALAREAAQLARHPVLSGWLFTATRNVAANVVRAERRRKAREQEISLMPEILPPEAQQADWSRLAPVLERAMDNLKEIDRSAVLLRFVDRQNFSAIGRTLHLSEEAARKRVERALEKLQVILGKRGINSTTTALSIALTSHTVTAAPAGLAATISSAVCTVAPTAIATTATIAGLMSATKLTIGAVTLVGLVTAYSLVKFQRRAQSEAQEAVQISSRIEGELSARKNELQSQIASAQAETQQLRRDLDAERLRASQAAAARTAQLNEASATAAWDPNKEGRAFLERHPEIKDALAKSIDATTRARYAPLFRSLNLSEDKIARFISIEAAYSSLNGVSSNGKSMWYSLSDIEGVPGDDFLKRSRELLGEEDFKKFNDYQKLLPARSLTTTIAGALALTGSPLSPTQADQLMTALGSNVISSSKGRPAQIDFPAAIAETRGFLSADQQAVLTAIEQKQALPKAITRSSANASAPASK